MAGEAWSDQSHLSPMRVTSLFLHPLHASLGSTVRVRELAHSLSNLGVETEILSPYEKDADVRPGVRIRGVGGLSRSLGFAPLLYRLTRKAYYSRRLVRSFLTRETWRSLLAKQLATSALKVLKQHPTDILQAEQDIAIGPCLELNKTLKLPLVASIHNLTSEELVASGVLSREDEEFRTMQAWMAEQLTAVDLTVVVSEEMQRYVITEYGVQKEKVVVVPPGGRPRVGPKRTVPPARNAVYAGLVSYREHVDLFVEAMPRILRKAPDTRFHITEKGDDLEEIRRLARDLGVSPTFFWYEGEEDFYDFLASCRVGVLPSTNDQARLMGTPVKMFDYLSVGLPIVANEIGGWTSMIRELGFGVLTSDSAAEFADAVTLLLTDDQLRQTLAQKALETVSLKHHWDNSAAILREAYELLLKAS